MRFAFTDEQLELRRGVRQVLERECTPADVRAVYAQATETPSAPPDRARYRLLADLGVTGVLAPVDAGGLDLDEVHLVGVAEEAGRVALPEPLTTVAGVVVPVLAALEGLRSTESDGRVAPWLRRIVSGETVAAVGGIEVRPDRLAVTTTPAGATGEEETPLVVAADWADVLLLVATTSEGPELHLVPAADASLDPVPTLDPTRRMAAVRWRPQAASRVAAGTDAARLMEEIADRSALVTAGELVGLTDALITVTAAYARERHQFGKPIGSFQAVKHHLAGARVRLEFARPALYRAAWSVRGEPASRGHDTSAALALAADAAELAAGVALQVHGAIGYTWECDIQLWMKRTWALGASGQVARVHRARVLRAALQRLGTGPLAEEMEGEGL